jgi:oligopeptide transport system substrate-binding protein
MKLGLTHHGALQFREARQAYDEGFRLSRQAELAMRNTVVPPPPAPHALRLPWHDPETVDPSKTHLPYDFVVIASLFSGLVRLSPEMEVLPDVAESWEMLEDGRVYHFHLRDDARWSDGRPVTSADFEYAFRRALDPVTGSPVASFMYVIKGGQAFHQGQQEDLGIHALDPSTLVVQLERPTGCLLYLLNHPNWHPVPRHVVEAKGDAWTNVGNIVTNGPFHLESWHPGESMVLTRNPSYHGRFAGNVQNVELLLSASVGLTIHQAICLEAYSVDDLDVVDFLSALSIDFPSQQHKGERFSIPAQIAAFVAFDLSQPPFDNREIRRAFALAIDRERLADVVLEGYHFPATGGLVPPGVPGHVPGIALPYDPDRGRQLLEEAGFPGGRGFPSVRMMVIEGYESVCESLHTQWYKNLGIRISLENVDYDTFIESIFARKVPPIIFSPWPADYPDPHNFLRDVLQVVPVHWGNSAYWALVEEATRTLDQGERMKLYARAEKILVEEAPVVPLLYLRTNLLVKPWVKYPVATGGYGFWQDVVIEPH